MHPRAIALRVFALCHLACVAAILLWRKGTALSSKLVMIVGAILGASFLYNLFEAVRYA